MSERPSMLAKAATILGLSDGELAQLVGLGRSTVQAYRSGRLPEHLDGKQVQTLLRACELVRDRIVQDVIELELMS